MIKEYFDNLTQIPENEIRLRLQKFRLQMEEKKIDALIFAGYADFEYVVGHLYTGWELHAARPMYAIISAKDFIVVASPSDQRLLELKKHLYRIEYYKGFQPEATMMVCDVIRKMKLGDNPIIGIDYGPDLFSVGNIDLIDALRNENRKGKVISAAPIVWSVRRIKSEYEAMLKKEAFRITDLGFDQVISEISEGISELEMQRLIKISLIQNGAERADAMALKFGKGDFLFNQMPGNRKLEEGDYIWGDFYNTFNGYPSDRCRIARCGEATDEEQRIYHGVREVTLRLCNVVCPGKKCSDIYHDFETFWKEENLPPIWTGAGRIGHSSGKDVLEPISIASWNEEIIEAGMIIHLEPKLEYKGGVFQLEEVVYVRENGPERLTSGSPEDIPIVSVK